MKKIEVQKNIIDYKDKYNGERCFILGNGPSLKEINFDILKDEYTFAINQINLIYDKVDWRPSVYCSFSERFRNKKWFNNISKNLELDIPIFLHKGYEEILKNDKFHYVDVVGTEICDHTDDNNFSYDIEKIVNKHGTTLLGMVEVAVYMGFKEILFIGCDLGYSGGKDHFIEGYLNILNPSQQNKNIRDTHLLIKRIADNIGVKVYNATIGGYLDVYERIDYEKFCNY